MRLLGNVYLSQGVRVLRRARYGAWAHSDDLRIACRSKRGRRTSQSWFSTKRCVKQASASTPRSAGYGHRVSMKWPSTYTLSGLSMRKPQQQPFTMCVSRGDLSVRRDRAVPGSARNGQDVPVSIRFSMRDDGTIEAHCGLPDGLFDQALNDAVSSRAPRGAVHHGLSTYWIDRAKSALRLALDETRTLPLASGNATSLRLEDDRIVSSSTTNRARTTSVRSAGGRTIWSSFAGPTTAVAQTNLRSSKRRATTAVPVLPICGCCRMCDPPPMLPSRSNCRPVLDGPAVESGANPPKAHPPGKGAPCPQLGRVAARSSRAGSGVTSRCGRDGNPRTDLPIRSSCPPCACSATLASAAQ